MCHRRTTACGVSMRIVRHGRRSSDGSSSERHSTSSSWSSRRGRTWRTRGLCCVVGPRRGAEGLDNRLRLTIGLRRDEGRWVVAHEHHSFPDKSSRAYPDGGTRTALVRGGDHR
ncbi:MAG: nuclear transport factor 2 family protein [Actinomycetota bacterium]